MQTAFNKCAIKANKFEKKFESENLEKIRNLVGSWG
jgi:hypothetical protein